MSARTPQDTFTQFVDDMNWIEAHYDELRALYPDQYVAVVNGKVVQHDTSISDLMTRLRSSYGDTASELAIKFIYSETPAIVL